MFNLLNYNYKILFFNVFINKLFMIYIIYIIFIYLEIYYKSIFDIKWLI